MVHHHSVLAYAIFKAADSFRAKLSVMVHHHSVLAITVTYSMLAVSRVFVFFHIFVVVVVV